MLLTKENLKNFGIAPEGAVVIPEGVIEIGKDAFYNCDKLVSVTIPNTVFPDRVAEQSEIGYN